MLLLVRFQSTLPTRGSDHEFLEQSDAEWVSIHAPHEGERRLSSLRVASYLSCFNPRSPRGGATLISGASSSQTMVSIHAPHEGERLYFFVVVLPMRMFQSTLPTRGSDKGGRPKKATESEVSIHAPHEGERHVWIWLLAQPFQFQSTLPTRGSDDYGVVIRPIDATFQSTLPTRGSDCKAVCRAALRLRVSIRAPHEGERRGRYTSILPRWRFQSTLPTRGSDCPYCAGHKGGKGFNPRSPRGGAT